MTPSFHNFSLAARTGAATPRQAVNTPQFHRPEPFKYLQYSTTARRRAYRFPRLYQSTTMRNAAGLATFLWTVLALSSIVNASFFSPLLSAFDSLSSIATNETSHEVLKRQTNANACPSGYNACSALGAPGLCCASTASCAVDQAGHVACCPSGAVCTGSISSIITAGTIIGGGGAGAVAGASSTSNSLLLGGGSSTSTTASTATTTTGNGLILASTNPSSTTGGSATTTQGFIIAASSTVATLGTGSGGARSLQMVGDNTQHHQQKAC